MLTLSQRLSRFLKYYREAKTYESQPIADVDFRYTEQVVKPFTIEWAPTPRHDYIGFSSIGSTPGIFLALHKLGYHDSNRTLTPKQRMRFAFGYWYEHSIVEMLRFYETHILQEVLNIETGTELAATEYVTNFLGHLDCVIDKRWLFDVKTMTSDHFKSFTKEPNNHLGYLTQLSLYKHYYERTHRMAPGSLAAGWLAMNLDTFELTVIDYEQELHEYTLRLAREKMSLIDNVTNLGEAYETFDFPLPKSEVFQKTPTGRHYVPANLIKHKYCKAMFHTQADLNGYKKLMHYFVRYTTKEEFVNSIKDIYGYGY